MKDKQQLKLLEEESIWQKEWSGMPEYNNIEIDKPLITATFKFKTEKEFELFNELIKEHLYNGEKPFDGMQRKNVKSTWFPLKQKMSKSIYVDESEISDIHNK